MTFLIFILSARIDRSIDVVMDFVRDDFDEISQEKVHLHFSIKTVI